MSPLAEFLDALLREGTAHFRDPPGAPAAGADPDAVRALAGAHAALALTVAGPPIPFDPAAALAAARTVRAACWLLVSRDEPPELVDTLVSLPGPPATAAAHLAADLTLRFLPGALRRARALADGPLAARLEQVLRDWPLSGVLADLDEAPAGDLQFAGHDGLMLLYDERWLTRPRPAWAPRGRGEALLELVRAVTPRGTHP